jgi:putrescine:ornithine antiporter
VTLAQRETVSFSISIFPGGISALLRTDASQQLQDALEERPPPYRPLWRGSTPQSIKALHKRTVAVVGGTAVVDLLVARMAALEINSTVAPVDSYAAGVASVVDRKSDMLVGERAILLDLAKRDSHARDLRVLTRRFEVQPIALALHRDDDPFRLVVDRSLSALYSVPTFGDIYAASFGPLDAATTEFFRTTIVPL